MGLARGGGGDPEGHAREAPHASGLRLHELEVAAADLLGDRGRGVGRDVLGGPLGGHARDEGLVRSHVSLRRPGLPYGHGAQRDDGVACRVAVEVVARGGREVRGAVLSRGDGPGAGGLRGEAPLVVLACVVADLELRACEAGRAERGRLARLCVGLSEHEAEWVRLRDVRRARVGLAACGHFHPRRRVREGIAPWRRELARPVGPGRDLDGLARTVLPGGQAHPRVLCAALVREEAVYGSPDGVECVAVRDRGVG